MTFQTTVCTTDSSSSNNTLALSHLLFLFHMNIHTNFMYTNIIVYPKLIRNFYLTILYIFISKHVTFHSPAWFLSHTQLYVFHDIYVLKSKKFKGKPVFKSQINLLFYLLRPIDRREDFLLQVYT